MALEIKKVNKLELYRIYDLLKQQDFPNLPKDKDYAIEQLSKPENHIYAGFEGDELMLFLCFSEKSSKLYFDIACAKNYEGKWATKKVMKFIFKTAFEELGYQEMFVESLTAKARAVVEKFGFEKVINYFYKITNKSASVLKYFKTK